MVRDSTYGKNAASSAVSFIGCLCRTKGIQAGKSFKLVDWQGRIIHDLFGILKPSGCRQFNTTYVEIPRKRDKPEFAAAVALLLCCAGDKERAEVYGCAADHQQAAIVFDVAANVVRMSPALKKRCKVLALQKRLIYEPTNSFHQVLSADVYSKHGFNVSGVILGKLHTQPNRKLYDVMTKDSGDARTQPFYFLITTAGTDEHSICYRVYQKALDTIEGRKHDPRFYPVIYGTDREEDWSDLEVWKKANPSLGVTVTMEKIKDAYNSAKGNPAEEDTFRQLRSSQWVKQDVYWMLMDRWDTCAFPADPNQLRGRPCYGGLDLSSITGITAFVLVSPPLDDSEDFALLPYFWIPGDSVDLRVRRDHAPYGIWKQQGFLQTTGDNVIHYGYIEYFIEELGKKYNIQETAFNRQGAVGTIQNLGGMGFTVVPFGQGFKNITPPTKELMRLILEKKIAHGGQPVPRWMMDSIYACTDPAGNIKPDKAKSAEEIDGVVATIMGLDRAIRDEGGSGGSVYDNRGLLLM